MITSQVARSATYSARTAWEFAKLPFRLRETALLAALIDLSQETPSDPAQPFPISPVIPALNNVQLGRCDLSFRRKELLRTPGRFLLLSLVRCHVKVLRFSFSRKKAATRRHPASHTRPRSLPMKSSLVLSFKKGQEKSRPLGGRPFFVSFNECWPSARRSPLSGRCRGRCRNSPAPPPRRPRSPAHPGRS